ncbi:MAG: rRNA methyltransferase [Cytophagales bacterium]|nr:MAG: rRNA methyltransferase [Cytophagales bacterium]
MVSLLMLLFRNEKNFLNQITPMLPHDFIQNADFALPKKEHQLFLDALTTKPPVSIRLNPFKSIQKFDNLLQVDWETQGKYLPERISFTTDVDFWSGTYYVQEASSMFVGETLRQILPIEKDLKILDLCAAPGGKSTHILSLLSDNSFLMSNEINRQRCQVLSENMARLGKANYVITNQSPENIGKWKGIFDAIVVDAPCSGEGMFRKDNNAKEEWSLENVIMCAERQQDILENIAPSLKEGGFLIYSTCTFNTLENEKNILDLLEQGFESIRLVVDSSWNIIEKETKIDEKTLYSYRFYPHLLKGEGFFITCLQKKYKENSQRKPNLKNPNLLPIPLKKQDFLSGWLEDISKFKIYITQKNDIFALPLAQADNMHLWGETLGAWQAGIPIGTRKHEDIEPSPALAFSLDLNKNIPKIELDLENALCFLRKNDINLPIPSKKGWYLATHNGFGLGWLKALPNRWNNYYPAQWKIKHF